MPQKPLSPEVLQQTINAVAEHGGTTQAARALGVPCPTFQHRVRRAKNEGYVASEESLQTPEQAAEAARYRLENTILDLRRELVDVKRHNLETETVRQQIIGLAEADPTPPKWTVSLPRGNQAPGVPTLFGSDWHWAETVSPEMVAGYNEFSIATGHARVKKLAERAVFLCKKCFSYTGDLPGMVLAFGGDMFSGSIHEELTETNEEPMMRAFLDLYAVGIWFIGTLAGEFGNLLVVGVAGNHSRTTRKPRHKNRAYTNFDWLLYSLWEKRFEGDKRIKFLVPAEPDALFEVYGHRYLLTHGDSIGAKGGDGMIGHLGPLTRGDFKVRRANAPLGRDYDTLMVGHFHQHLPFRGLVCNGSLKGYDEYAKNNRLTPEPPIQHLHFTHPEYGTIWPNAIFLGEDKAPSARPWVSWEK